MRNHQAGALPYSVEAFRAQAILMHIGIPDLFGLNDDIWAPMSVLRLTNIVGVGEGWIGPTSSGEERLRACNLDAVRQGSARLESLKALQLA